MPSEKLVFLAQRHDRMAEEFHWHILPARPVRALAIYNEKHVYLYAFDMHVFTCTFYTCMIFAGFTFSLVHESRYT